MKKTIFFSVIVCLLLSTYASAQNTTTLTLKVVDGDTNTPLISASVYLKSLNLGAITNDEGLAALDSVMLGQQVVAVSFMGFKTIVDTIQVTNSTPIKTYVLQASDLKLEEITIEATRSTRTIKRIPTRIEFISSEELGEKTIMNASNISMVLRESTGIQVQQTSLSSVNSSIRIQGLDGRYTQILKDGFPLFGGFSGGLSINQIPPLDLKQFEIIKGSASTLYGGGAIAGLVNLVSKTPEEEPSFDIQLAQTDVGGSTVNVFYSERKGKFGYTLYASGHHQNIYDPNHDDFSNLPETNTLSFNPKLFYYPSQSETIWLGINGTFDKRKGGDVTVIKHDTNGIHQYFEKNISTRISTQAAYEKAFDNDRHLQIKNSVSYFDRKLTTPDIHFLGRQWDVFAEANYTIQQEKSDWIFGGNFYSNSFKERDNPTPRNQDDITFGAFVNNTSDLSEQFILETGFRTDLLPSWGAFPLPRVSLLWKANAHFSSRLGGGLGYKIPDIFTEDAAMLNFEDILPIDKTSLTAERSYGGNIDFNYNNIIFDDIGFSVNQLFYITAIDNALLLNQQPNGAHRFENAKGVVLSKGAETNIKFTYKDFRWFINYAYVDATLNYLPGNPQKSLTPKHQAGSILMYENEKWRIGYEIYYTGRQMLSVGLETHDFFTMGLLLQRHFKWGSLYTNFENFTDRRQSRFSPETLPPHQDPRFVEIYAPTDGFVFTVGVVINPFGRKDEH